MTRHVLDRNGPAPVLDEVDEPVGGIEGELHIASLGEHMFVRKTKERAAGLRPSRVLGGAALGDQPPLTALLSWLPAENFGTVAAGMCTF
jgi:hypothetical protein